MNCNQCFRDDCEKCRLTICTVCEHGFGVHYNTHDGSFSGCADCGNMFGSCEGFGWLPREDEEPPTCSRCGDDPNWCVCTTGWSSVGGMRW